MNDKVNYRTCVCCRALKSKYEMARVAVVEGNAVCDSTYKAGGRGFYICSKGCLDKVLSSRKFTRYSGYISDETMLNNIEEMLDDEYKS